MSQHCSPGLAAALIADTSARGEWEWLGLIACHGSGREGFSASLQIQGLLLSHPHVRVIGTDASSISPGRRWRWKRAAVSLSSPAPSVSKRSRPLPGPR